MRPNILRCTLLATLMTLTALVVVPATADATGTDCPTTYSDRALDVISIDDATVSSNTTDHDAGLQLYHLEVDDTLATDFICAGGAGCTVVVVYSVTGSLIPAGEGHVAKYSGSSRVFTSVQMVAGARRLQAKMRKWPNSLSLDHTYTEPIDTYFLDSGSFVQVRAEQQVDVVTPGGQLVSHARLGIAGTPVLQFRCGLM